MCALYQHQQKKNTANTYELNLSVNLCTKKIRQTSHSKISIFFLLFIYLFMHCFSRGHIVAAIWKTIKYLTPLSAHKMTKTYAHCPPSTTTTIIIIIKNEIMASKQSKHKFQITRILRENEICYREFDYDLTTWERT